ncbi:hypothetical protein LYNGBM3L_20260 [Moorena producens 3L]|uniref:Uncharacterized protein n=1 Tax=Moorena producens 3L TaxID=489825 RepID=F4XNN5_9CYAN|nr:hypothetical protein LYNGBM3L_20260 [Moorena producens 3L]
MDVFWLGILEQFVKYFFYPPPVHLIQALVNFLDVIGGDIFL